ncbi:MAG: hypothetical protein HYY01_03920 [Chloroflexi bacterium]|nr:hypothetical protein [Chloroflexota bacterium]
MVRLYSGEDGQSQFEDLDLPTGPEGRSPWQAATGISFHQHPLGWSMDWHNAPRRQFVIILAGEVEYGVGDGSVRRLGAGDVLLAEDLTGKGHTARDVSSQPRVSMYISLA